MKDDLGNRMKDQYENRTRFLLPRRTYTIIRVDGKSFHTFTKDCEKPYDSKLASAMVYAALELCLEAQGAKFGYIQSDEISVLLEDFETINTEAWFNGNIQKIASVSASIVTRNFNAHYGHPSGASFDTRVFTIPDPIEVENYFIWRQQDASRNSLSMLARTHFSHNELEGVNSPGIHDMLMSKGINWNDCFIQQKRGIIVRPKEYQIDTESPVFTEDRTYLRSMIGRPHANNQES